MDSRQPNDSPPEHGTPSILEQTQHIFGSALLVDPSQSTANDSALEQPEAAARPAAAQAAPEPAAQAPSTPAPSTPTRKLRRRRTERDPRKCWICLQEEGVDSPPDSVWRSPCPCSLQAHEECLLEWIRDSQDEEESSKKKILCPQCKNEIKVERPTELLILLEELAVALGRHVLLPGGILMVTGILFSGSMVYGYNTLEIVFGEKEVHQFIRDLQPFPFKRTFVSQLPPFAQDVYNAVAKVGRLISPFYPKTNNSGLFMVAPLIAPALLLSRTDLADGVFNLMPIPVSHLPFPLFIHDINNLSSSSCTNISTNHPCPSPPGHQPPASHS